MCTAISFFTKDHYFGRNLDLEVSYGEQVVISPRNFPFNFRNMGEIKSHYAIIGMATVVAGVPLFYDATNEVGLSMAGLNFPDNCFYPEMTEGKDNIPPFEFIPWILSQCKTVAEAKVLLAKINLVNESFSPQFPLATLHWMISDREATIVVESVKDGLKIYDNPVGVMTNNPPFDKQLFNLNNYRNVSPKATPILFAEGLELEEYSRGMGGIGLPGDLSSASRFVKATFTKLNSICADDERSSISQFMHILQSVCQQRGCCRLGDDNEITIYSSCVNVDKGIYYYTTYDNSRVCAVDMHKENLDGSQLYCYPLQGNLDIAYQN